MTDYIDSYYAQTLADFDAYPPLTQDVVVDVCIIGGGLAGLNTALELVKTGKSVVLLEARRIAWGASGRNGGFVVPGYALGAHELVKKVGLPHAQRLYSLINQAMHTIRSRIKDFNITNASPVQGMMKLTLHEYGEALKYYSNYMSWNFGQTVEHWTTKQIQEILNTTRYSDGAFYPEAFHFHALNYAHGIAREAVRLGADIHENSTVLNFTDKGQVKTIHTEKGIVRANDIVLACSSYIEGLYAPLGNAIVPVATYVMCTEPLGHRLKDTIREPYAFLDNRFANDYYRPLPDTRILWGGRVSVRQPSINKIMAMLRQDMLQVFPQLSDVKIESAWGCYMGYARHKMPQIGQYKPGIWYCTGFGGYGMSATTVGGRVIAEALSGNTQNLDLFKPFGLHFTGGRLLAPVITQMMYWGYQAADWIKAR